MKNELVIFGVKSTGLEIYELVMDQFDTQFTEVSTALFNDEAIEELENKARKATSRISFIIGFSDYRSRLRCSAFLSKIDVFEPVTIISPHAYISPSARIGKGCFIGANASISSNATIGNHSIVNLNVSVGHDAQVGEHVLLYPGARIGGNVSLGDGSIVGSNAFLNPGITVGNENIVDALTYIRDTLPPRMISSSRNTKTFKRID